jgi:DNA-binding beta-propeller fold protein YncE
LYIAIYYAIKILFLSFEYININGGCLMKNIQRILFVLFLLFVTSSFAQSQMLYGAGTGVAGEGGNQPSSLYMINPATGEATLIGPIGFNGVTGLELLPDGRLIASANADIVNPDVMGDTKIAVLIEIDRNTGAGQPDRYIRR